MTLSQFQEQVRALVPEQFRYPRVFAALALVEEFSEFCAECLECKGTPPAIESELGDILFSCAEIANEYDFLLAEPAMAIGSPGEASSERQLLFLAVAVGEVARCVLDIECFDSVEHAGLIGSVQSAASQAFVQARSRGVDPLAALSSSLTRIRGRIESGKWQKKYGEVLIRKRKKHN